MRRIGSLFSAAPVPFDLIRDLHHQLADCAARAEFGDGLAAVLEGEGFADVRVDAAFFPQAEEVIDMRGVRLGIAGGEGAPENAADVAAFQQCQVEREFWNAGGEADDEVAPFPTDRA